MAEKNSLDYYDRLFEEEYNSEESIWETEADDGSTLKYEFDDYESEGLILRNRYETMAYATNLTPYFEHGSKELSELSELSNRDNFKALLPDAVMTELQNWLGEVESRMIWIQGLPTHSYGSDLSLAALHIVSLLEDEDIPCISFFVKPRDHFAPSVPQHQAALIALLYSIVAQLVYLLPVEFEDVDELDEAKFQKLDGSFGSVPLALQMIQALLRHAPPALVWVLDGFHLAENQDTIPHLEALVDILLAQESVRISQVCFTTDSISAVLNSKMKQVCASETGGSDINGLSIPSSRFY
ncbi:hypothetical protein F5Y00DRAFT_267208 [Daldinia vernicosa]|uniref:uncharacterized protein n=1 Tax=Daldinia vernicosa TaxID=114800 RepID=UPI0020085384|nr:uncharacterized protein F5Y00DRAFT_267208 [Daldinia vernicosa]KAI0843803.1 hypothetical protein F5Y00DRAFT_267208 [Daldinia vernicosa]